MMTTTNIDNREDVALNETASFFHRIIHKTSIESLWKSGILVRNINNKGGFKKYGIYITYHCIHFRTHQRLHTKYNRRHGWKYRWKCIWVSLKNVWKKSINRTKSISIKLCKTKRINKLTLFYSIATLFLRRSSTIYASGKSSIQNACRLQFKFSTNQKREEPKERSEHKSKINESFGVLEHGCLCHPHRFYLISNQCASSH